MKKRIRRPSVQELNSLLGVPPRRPRRRGVGKFTKSWLESVELPSSLMMASSGTSLHHCLTPDFHHKNASHKGDGGLHDILGAPCHFWAGINVRDVSPYGGRSMNRCDGGEGDPPAYSPCPNNPPTTKCAPEIKLDVRFSCAAINSIYPSAFYDGTKWNFAGGPFGPGNPTGYDAHYAYVQLIFSKDQYCNLSSRVGAGYNYFSTNYPGWEIRMRLFTYLNVSTGELKLSVTGYMKRLSDGYMFDATVTLNPCCYIYLCCPC